MCDNRTEGAQGDSLIEVKLPKCRVFLTPAEIGYLLRKDPDFFATVIGRSKGILRARAARERREKCF